MYFISIGQSLKGPSVMPVRDDCEVLWILKIELGTVLSNMKVIVNESEAVDIENSVDRTAVSC